jgi:hypothetical protein
MNKKGVIVCFILLCISSLGFAQDDLTCPEKLSEAKRRFEQGKFYSIPGLLEDCVKKNGLNEQQKIEAYFLLSQTYLFIDEPAKAEESYISILRIDPEFKPDEERAPIDQVYLSEKFTTRPIFVVNARFGANYTSVDVIESFSTSDQEVNIPEYKLGIGFEGAVGLDVVFSDFLSIGTEIGVVQKKYTFEQTMFSDDQQSMTENLWSLEVPLFARFRWKIGNVTPYIFGGPALNYTIGSSADVTLIDNRFEPVEGIEDPPPIPVSSNDQFKMLDQREKINYAILFGGGVRIKSGYNYISIDLRYRAGLNNIVDKDRQFDNQDLVFRYAYVDDYKKLNNLVLSIGYVNPFYKPRKKRKYR